MALPSLPTHENHGQWPSNVHHAYQVLCGIYKAATVALETQSDLLRLHFHANAIMNEAIPILLAFESSTGEEKLPTAWLSECTTLFAELITQLDDAELTARGQYVVVSQINCSIL